MPKRIVDAFADGFLVASYTISRGALKDRISEADVVEMAKQKHAEDGLSPALVDKWIVREP